jgi:hypothetical protein
LTAEPDSLVRQLYALLEYARALGRVPDVREALRYIETQRLYTGLWEDNERKRENRVGGIVTFIGRTFDPTKCRSGPLTLDLDGYTHWLEAVLSDDECSQLPTDYALSFAAILDFTMCVDPNEDGSVPRQRVQSFWTALHKMGLLPTRWSRRQWDRAKRLAIARDVVFTTQKWRKGQAKVWYKGDNFVYHTPSP